MKFNERLKILFQKGLEAGDFKSKADFGRRCGWIEGTPTSRISQYLDGSRIPKPEDAEKLADTLGITFFDLIKETDYKKATIIKDKRQSNKTPIVDWIDIPRIYKDLSLLESNENNIDLSFPREESLFASKIPDLAVPGSYNPAFPSGSYVLISPKRELAHGQYILIKQKKWIEPIYATYYDMGDECLVHYPWEKRPRKIKEDGKIQICGVVVAVINIFILK